MGKNRCNPDLEKNHVPFKSFDSNLNTQHPRKRILHSYFCTYHCKPYNPDCEFETNSQLDMKNHLRNIHAI